MLAEFALIKFRNKIAGAAVIAVISVAIAMSVFMALGICIGARTYWNKR